MACFRDSDSCGETCDRFCPCVSNYPGLCTAFLSLLGAAVICAIFGGYVFTSLRLSIFQFSWTSLWFLLIHSSFIPIALIFPLTILSLLLWCICSTRKKACAFKAFYIILLLVAILLTMCAMVAAIVIIYGASGTNGNSFFVRELERAWVESIQTPNSTIACRIQAQLSCRGFEEGDCNTGSPTANVSRCGVVCRPQDERGKALFDKVIYPGCRALISSYFVSWNSVLLAGSSVALLFLLTALFVTCKISFEPDYNK